MRPHDECQWCSHVRKHHAQDSRNGYVTGQCVFVIDEDGWFFRIKTRCPCLHFTEYQKECGS